MIKITSLLFLFLFAKTALPQENTANYALHVYELIVNGDARLADEFVDLNQYTAYVDRLTNLPEEDRELMKDVAAKSYSEVKNTFNTECLKILKLYQGVKKKGSTFTYLKSIFTPSKSFPDIGMLTCFYIANIPNEEEPLEDAIRFEVIKTSSGWRILDGFYDDPAIN